MVTRKQAVRTAKRTARTVVSYLKKGSDYVNTGRKTANKYVSDSNFRPTRRKAKGDSEGRSSRREYQGREHVIENPYGNPYDVPYGGDPVFRNDRFRPPF